MKKTATRDIWTSGITNIPKNDRDARYTFFELDTKDIDKLHFVLDVYRQYLGSCYVHELISGFHFFNLTPISKTAYNEIINKIKHLNPLCPLTVLRIIPNKWNEEKRYWNIGEIIGIDRDNKLLELMLCLKSQDQGSMEYLDSKYEIVRYPFEECPKCKMSNKINWDSKLELFYCMNCQEQTIGRIKPRTDPNMTLEEQRVFMDRMRRRYNTTW